jgi:YidC/Oxa1 family membrane protein insertase
MENTMKMMNWMMPAIMLVTTFTLPSAMGFYWIVSNLMAVVQQGIIYLLFNKPLEEKKAEMAILKAHAFSKTAMVTEVDSSINTVEKQKSAKSYSKSSAKYNNKSNRGGKR